MLLLIPLYLLVLLLFVWLQRTIFIGIVCVIIMPIILIDFMLETLNPYPHGIISRFILSFFIY